MIAVYLPNERGVRRSWRDATHRRLISSTRRWQKHNCQNAESTAKHIWAVNTWHSYRSSHGGGQTCPSNGCLRVSWRHLSALLPFLDFRSSKSDTENQTVFCNLLWGALSSNLRFQGASLRLRLLPKFPMDLPLKVRFCKWVLQWPESFFVWNYVLGRH